MRRILILVMLLCPLTSWAATYYVDDSGTGTTCTHALNAATRHNTITEGIACLAAGDTLIIGNGTYAEYINDTIPSGLSAAAPTIIQAENRNQAILRPTTGSPNAAIVYTAGNSYITFDGLDVDGVSLPAYSQGYAITGNGISNIVIKNGTVRNNKTTSQFAAGIVIASGAAGDCDGTSTSHTIQNMDLSNNGTHTLSDHGIYPCGIQNSVIEGNRISSSSAFGIHMYGHGHGLTRNNIIRGNVITTSGLEGILVSDPYNIVYNNVLYGNGAGGIVFWSGFSTNNKAYNNTIYNNTGYCVLDSTNGDYNTITNNICRLNGAGAISAAPNSTCTTNLNVGGNGVGNTCSATQGTTDPTFVNAGTFDFRLLTGSPAIDVGTTLSDVDADFIGTARPQNTTYDLGAYEFFTGGSPTRVSFATDNFTNASTALVSTYSAANWAIVYDNGSANGVYVDAATDVAYGKPTITDIPGGPWVARRADTGTGWQNDQYASCAVTTLPPTTPDYGSIVGVVARASTDIDANRDYLLAELYGAGGSRCVSLQQFTNGVKSNLGDWCGTWAVNDLLEIDVIGSTVRALKNGTALISSSTTLTSGFPGIAGAGNDSSILAALDTCDFGGFSNPNPPSGNITVTLPTTGTRYQRPSPSVRIEWTTQNITGDVDLEYSLNNGVDYHAIATVGYNTSPYFWTANIPRSSLVKVCVKQGAASACSGAFSVRGQYIR